MTFRALSASLALACLVAAGACTVSLNAEATLYVRPRSFVRVTSACPAPKSDDGGAAQRPARPDVNAIWVSGHWTWESGWVWASGRWTVPRPGYTWEPPVCTARGGSFRFYPGYFRGRQEEPPPVYREPGHIRVHTPSDEDEELPPRVVVRPGTTPPTDTGPDIEVRGPESTANTTVRTSDDDDRPDSEVQGGGDDTATANTTVRPDSTAQGNDSTANTTVRPDSTAQGNQSTSNTTVSAGPLECSIRVRRIPRGGNVQIQGRGFTERVTVMISGNTATIRQRTATSISAVANHAGEVKVIRGEDQATCGRISLIR